jgi:hypothetical protein
MTVDEIALAVSARQAQNKELAQMLAWIVYNGAALIGVAVNDPKKFPRPEDAFPNLFERKEQQDWWVMKERMEGFRKGKRRG